MRIYLLLIVITLTFTSCKNEKKNNLTEKATTENVLYNGKHCFFSKIENNRLVLEATINKDSITGNYNYFPENGKESKGVFKGVLKGNVANTICEFTQDGKKINEELIFKITKEKASILGGEKEEKDGVWCFIDASKGVYMNDIPRRNCN